jgi:hypothetical protein
MKNENLQEDTRDMLVSILKASTSLLPSLGPLLYEIIASVIPEQRLDRIADFIENLEKRLNRRIQVINATPSLFRVAF